MDDREAKTSAARPRWGRLSRAAAGVMKRLRSQRIRPVWTLGLILSGVFSGFRLGLLLSSWSQVRAESGANLWHCLILGMQYDLKPIGAVLLPIALLLSLAPPAWFRRKPLRWSITVYATILLILCLTMEIIGAAFFSYFGFRLDSTFLQYMEHYHEVVGYVTSQYPVGLILAALAAGMLGVGWVFHKLFWRGSIPLDRPQGRFVQAISLSFLCLLAIRGSLGRESLQMDGAHLYFTRNNLVVELTRNNLSTVADAVWSSVVEPWEESELFGFPGPEQAGQSARQLFAQDQDTFLGNPYNPLWRRTRSVRPAQDMNVVLIVMESMSGSMVGAVSGGQSQTPFLDDLSRQGLYFNRMYAVGPRTNRGLTGIFCGHPDFLGPTLLKRDEAVGNVRTLSSILADRGYRTMFFYGADPEFDNMRQFFTHAGIGELYCRQTMQGVTGAFSGGYHDEVVFDKALETFQGIDEHERFFATILTLSNHDPWVVPTDRCPTVPAGDDSSEKSRYNRRINAYRYADWALHRFFENFRDSRPDLMANTLFVLVADHCQQAELDKRLSIDALGFRIPCLMWAPGREDLTPPRTISTVCSQTDLAPTLLSLLGGEFEHCFFGRDVLSVRDEGFALLRRKEPLGFIRGDRMLVLPPQRKARLYKLTPFEMSPLHGRQDAEQSVTSMTDDLLAYYSMARYLFLNRAMQRPPGLRPAQALKHETVGLAHPVDPRAARPSP